METQKQDALQKFLTYSEKMRNKMQGRVLFDLEVPFEWAEKENKKAIEEQKVFFKKVFLRMMICTPIVILAGDWLLRFYLNTFLPLPKVFLMCMGLVLFSTGLPYVVFTWFPGLVKATPYRLQMRKKGLFKVNGNENRLIVSRRMIKSYSFDQSGAFHILHFHIKNFLFPMRKMSFAYNQDEVDTDQLTTILQEMGLQENYSIENMM